MSTSAPPPSSLAPLRETPRRRRMHRASTRVLPRRVFPRPRTERIERRGRASGAARRPATSASPREPRVPTNRRDRSPRSSMAIARRRATRGEPRAASASTPAPVNDDASDDASDATAARPNKPVLARVLAFAADNYFVFGLLTSIALASVAPHIGCSANGSSGMSASARRRRRRRSDCRRWRRRRERRRR